MITSEQQTIWYKQQLSQVADQLPGNDIGWLSRARHQAESALSELPVLDRKQEAWRYTSVEGLMSIPFLSPQSNPSETLAAFNELELPSTDSYQLIFINGQYVPHLAKLDGISSGVKVGGLADNFLANPMLFHAWFGQVKTHDKNIFSELNTALASDGLFLHIDKDVELDKPIEVVYFNTQETEPVSIQSRSLIMLESGSKATLVEHFIGEDQANYFHNHLAEIVVGKEGSLRHYRIQDESRNAYHLGNIALSQAEGSLFQNVTVSFGGMWARTDYHTAFTGENAKCDLSGLYLVSDNQLSDFHLKVHHNVPGCESREQFKGILYGKGRGVFDGHILVDPQAQKTDAHLTNDNLMLSRDAEVDTKPQLEIYADDVKCSHGTTIGEIEADQLFYIRSRGFDAETAKKMLSLGFAGEVIDNIDQTSLREYAYELLTKSMVNIEPLNDSLGGEQ